MIYVPQWHNENFENLHFFCVDEFQLDVSITSFKEQLIYTLKTMLKFLNTKKKVKYLLCNNMNILCPIDYNCLRNKYHVQPNCT